MSRRSFLAAAAVAFTCGASAAAQAQTEIQWWHAMGGQLGEALNALADGFNKSQPDYNGQLREIFFGFSTTRLGEGHVPIDDPKGRSGQTKQEIIDRLSPALEPSTA